MFNLDFHNGIATLTLARPELHNAFNAEFIQRLSSEFERLHHLSVEKRPRVLILKAQGKSFCAGADVNWMKSMKDFSEEENVQDSQKMATMFRLLNTLPFPTIGFVQGSALGGGAGLVACLDYVLAAEEAMFGFTEVKLGLIPAVISPFVIQKIGVSWARATFMSGERFSAAQALQMGLIHQVESAEKFETTSQKVLQGFLSAAPKAAMSAKNLIWLNRPVLNPELERETCRRIALTRVGVEAQEGMQSLLEKRKPNWLGHTQK